LIARASGELIDPRVEPAAHAEPLDQRRALRASSARVGSVAVFDVAGLAKDAAFDAAAAGCLVVVHLVDHAQL
jgi:hypothetical protein